MVEVDSVRISESLVQVTLVAGPPVETQVRVKTSGGLELRTNAGIAGILTTPADIV